MKTGSLNLLNFELPQAANSGYVLTSPRSLRACRRAGVKPVELLYRCAEELGGDQQLHQGYEAERQGKLRLCRALRNELLLNGDWISPQNLAAKYDVPSPTENIKQFPEIRGNRWSRKGEGTAEDLRMPQRSPTVTGGGRMMDLPKVNLVFDNDDISGNIKLPKVDQQSKESQTNQITKKSHNFETEEDINNNTVKANKKKRQGSTITGRRPTEKKKHLKMVERKKAIRKMKIQYSDPDYSLYKYRELIENSLVRDARRVDVEAAQRQLDLDRESWEDRLLLLHWLDSLRAVEQVYRELQVKVEKIQQKNRDKSIIHTININRIKEAEDMKKEGLRKQVEEKKRKILTLRQEKERIVHESKTRSQSLQELREHIRNIESPETFDRKVAKMNLTKKVLNTQMCSRIMHSSHISLG